MTDPVFSSILALETSTDACSVAVRHRTATASRCLVAPGAHASSIMGLIEDALVEANAEMGDIEGIVYGHGPGSFTGVRIAVALAQGLADGLGVPVLGLSSLRLLAQRALTQRGGSSECVLVAQDARMDQLYAGWYRIGGDGIAVACRNDRLVDVSGFDAMDAQFGVGGAFARLPEWADTVRAQGVSIDASDGLPDAREALKIAQNAPASHWGAATEASPVYLRDQVASPASSG